MLTRFAAMLALLPLGCALLAPPHAGAGCSLLSLPYERLHSLVGGAGAKSVWRHLRSGRDPAAAAAGADGLCAAARASLAAHTSPSHVAPVVREHSTSDGTRKLLLRLRDGHEVETVLIPPRPDVAGGGRARNARARSTLCVSSQVGCRQGCRFCATGTMGLFRSLDTDEVLAQVFAARGLAEREALPPLSNLVFMGMGEPADNVPAVRGALAALTDRRRFGFSPRAVTVSTVAPTAAAFGALLGIGEEEAPPPPALAWSLHAADASLRRRLVPTAVDEPEALREGLCAALAALPPRRRRLVVEYVLLGGVNDGLAEADELAAFLRPVEAACFDPGRASRRTGVLVNLIPYNDGGGGAAARLAARYERPTWAAIDAFQARLRQRGVWVSVRAQRGADDSSACGQLWAQQPQARRHQPAAGMV